MAGFHPDTDRLFDDAIADMKRLGAEIVDPADVPGIQELGDPEFEVLLFEFKAGLEAYFASLGPSAARQDPRGARLLQRSEPRARDAVLRPGDRAEGAGEGPAHDTRVPRGSREVPAPFARAKGSTRCSGQHKLDAIVAPTGAPAWMIDPVSGDHFVGGNSTPAAVAGYPSLSVPMGFVFGLPVGLSFFGRAWSEALLVRLAYAYEQATKHRKPPRFLATAELPRPS